MPPSTYGTFKGECILYYDFFETGFTEIKIDSQMLSGFLTAIYSFGQELTQDEMRGIIFTKQ